MVLDRVYFFVDCFVDLRFYGNDDNVGVMGSFKVVGSGWDIEVGDFVVVDFLRFGDND